MSDEVTFVLPDELTEESVQDFVATIPEDQYGRKTFIDRVERYLRTKELATRQLEDVHLSVNTLNGKRSNGTGGGFSKESYFRNLFTKTYNDKNGEKKLKGMCGLYDVDWNAYEEVDQIIEALVEAATSVSL